MKVKKILFIGLSSVGDVVMTTPVLKSLQEKYPEALFDIVVDKRGTGLYKNYPRLNKLYLKDKNRAFRGVPDLLLQLWKNRYDLIVDVRTDGLAYLLRARKRYTKWFAKSYGPHAVENLMGVIADLHGDQAIPDAHVWPSDTDRVYAEEKLSVFADKDRLLALSIGDSRKPIKTWPASSFIELLKQHRNEFSGVIFMGNSFEAEETEKVSRNIDLPFINTVGNSLLEAAALLERSRLYIGPDSGLGHIAAAVGVPTVSFFSHVSPEQYRPWGNKSECLSGANNDARNISVNEVSAAVRRILDE